MKTAVSQKTKSVTPAFSIEPIGIAAQQQVVAQTEHFIRLGGELLGRHFDSIPVHFDLKGRTAGMYKVVGRGHCVQRIIRYNPWIFAKYYENNLSVTVPHEVAHYLVDCIYSLGAGFIRKRNHKVRPHGAEWKSVMDAFGVDSSVTSKFDLVGIPTRQHRQFEYLCACKTHQLGIRRHNKVFRGEASYLCRNCGESLKPVAVVL